MKKSTLIWILFLAWISSAVLTVVLINKHIEDKDARLRNEIRKNIEEIFEGQYNSDNFITFDDGFFDSPMHGGEVKNFKRTEIPLKPKRADFDYISSLEPKAYEIALSKWQSDYGDVASLWDLNWGSNDIHEQYDGGWHIVGIRCHGLDESFIHQFAKFPYRVALKRSEWGNYYTVPQAVSEAYDFFTTNPKSGISDRFVNGSLNRIWSKIYDCNNEYYGVYKNEKDHSHYAGRPLPGGASPEQGGPIEDTWMHNGYYRVYVASTQETHFGIFKHSWNPDIAERNRLMLWWLIGISIAFLIPIIILTIKVKNINKRKSESMIERLLRICSPKQFMSPYNKELIDKANSIYPRITEAHTDEELVAIADEAQNLLGVSLIEKSQIDELLAKVNPTKFMAPYNSEKVAIANELYSILQKQNLKYSEFVNVTKRLNELK